MRFLIHLGFVIAVSGAACASAVNSSLLASILEPVDRAPRSQSANRGDKITEPAAQTTRMPAEKPVKIGLDDVLQRIQEQVGAELDDGSGLNLTSISRWDRLLIAPGREWDIVLKTPFAPDTRGRWHAMIDIVVENEPVTTRNLRIDATLFREVWITSRRLERGESPSVQSLQAAMRDVYLERGNPVPSSELLNDYELVRAVPDGYLLKWEDLRLRPSVRRGELVEVTAHHGSMTVTMRARSLEDGLPGESVTVKNLNSQRELVGTVIGPDKVRIIP